jgi:hypothetical protein
MKRVLKNVVMDWSLCARKLILPDLAVNECQIHCIKIKSHHCATRQGVLCLPNAAWPSHVNSRPVAETLNDQPVTVMLNFVDPVRGDRELSFQRPERKGS